jgi:hypothetical protein
MSQEQSLAVQASRATGAPAGQRPAPGPCGPVARATRQYVVIDGQGHPIDNPQFGAGPSSAPACPDSNTHVWLHGAWRKVFTDTYAAAAGSYLGTPLTANRTTRVATLSTNPANRSAAVAPPAATRAATASTPGAPTAIEAEPSSRQSPGSSRAQTRCTRDENNWGYQVKLFGPRRTATTIAQVRAAGMGAVAQMSEGASVTCLLAGHSGQERQQLCSLCQHPQCVS